MGRVTTLIEQQQRLFGATPQQIVRDAIAAYPTTAGRYALFSGGEDSVTLAHWLWTHDLHGTYLPPEDPAHDPDRIIDGLLHVDTGTGIRSTRQFVVDFAARYRMPLHVLVAPAGEYERLLLRLGGFPGPAKHGEAQTRLKARQFDAFVRDRKRDQPPGTRVMLFTGKRRAESARRARTTQELDDSTSGRVFVAPLIDWTRADMRDWRTAHDVPISDSSALLHSSGECLCGAMSKPDELTDLAWAAPDRHRWIRRLQTWAEWLGLDRDRWGQRLPGEQPADAGPLCDGCQQQALFPDGQAATGCPTPRTTTPITVIEHQARRPNTLTARLHDPGSDPGPLALIAGGLQWVSMTDTLTLDGEPVSDLGDHSTEVLLTDGRIMAVDSGFAYLRSHPGPATTPLQRMLAEHGGEEHTSWEITVHDPDRQRRDRRGHHIDPDYRLCAYALQHGTSPQTARGVTRLTSTDGFWRLNRAWQVRGHLMLDDTIAGIRTDVEHHDGTPAGRAWWIPGLGPAHAILILHATAAAAFERDLAQHGHTVTHTQVAGRDHDPLAYLEHLRGMRTPHPATTTP